MSTQNKYKHLTAEERQEIMDCLYHGMNFKDIAKRIGKDQTTVSKEVKKHITVVPAKYAVPDSEPAICSFLLKPPYVCNGCQKRTACRKTKHYYHSKEAQETYKKTLVESREGIPLTKESFYRADEILLDGVKKGQHIYHIASAHHLGMSVSTVYRNVKKNYFSVSALDLPRAVKFKERKSSPDTYVPSGLRKGRSFQDFESFIDQQDISYWVEMDTVIGSIGGKVILTFDFTDCNFMFGLLLDNKTAAEAASKVIALKKRLIRHGFRFGDIFPVILTDNGGEFSNIHAFIDDPEGAPETHLFFCDPYRSSQKPYVEKNHTLFRSIVPKGTSFDRFTQKDVDTIFSHVNSVKRRKLHQKSPYEVFCCLFSHLNAVELASLFGIRPIDPEDVVQSPLLLKQLS